MLTCRLDASEKKFTELRTCVSWASHLFMSLLRSEVDREDMGNDMGWSWWMLGKVARELSGIGQQVGVA